MYTSSLKKYLLLYLINDLIYYQIIICPNIAPHSPPDWIKLLKRSNRYRAWSGIWSTVSSNQLQDRNADEAHVNHAILSSRHHRPLTLRKLHVQDLLGSKLTTSSVYTFLPHPRVFSLFSILLLPFYPSLSRYTLLNFFQSYLPLFIFRLFYVFFFLSRSIILFLFLL